MRTTFSADDRIAGRAIESPHHHAVHGAAYPVSVVLAIVAAIGMASTFFIPGVLRGTAVMNGSARGTALVLLAVVLPVMVASMLWAAGGSMRAHVIWLGTIAYVIYNSVMFVFGTPFNNLYLLYEAMLGLGIWSAALVIRKIDIGSFARYFSQRLPARAIAVYALVLVVLNTLAWLMRIVPAVFSTSSPDFLQGTGLVTNPGYDQDLAFWLPLTAVGAILMWRRRAWGYLIVGSALTMLFFESVGIAVDQWFGGAADPSSPVASAAVAPAFLVLALIGLVPLLFYYRSLDDHGGEFIVGRRPRVSA